MVLYCFAIILFRGRAVIEKQFELVTTSVEGLVDKRYMVQFGEWWTPPVVHSRRRWYIPRAGHGFARARKTTRTYRDDRWRGGSCVGCTGPRRLAGVAFHDSREQQLLVRTYAYQNIVSMYVLLRRPPRVHSTTE